jgi:hypothetical protein
MCIYVSMTHIPRWAQNPLSITKMVWNASQDCEAHKLSRHFLDRNTSNICKLIDFGGAPSRRPLYNIRIDLAWSFDVSFNWRCHHPWLALPIFFLHICLDQSPNLVLTDQWVPVVPPLSLSAPMPFFLARVGPPTICLQEFGLPSPSQFPLLGVALWYVQNVSTFPNTFAIVSPLICVFWIQLTRTNAVFSRIALVPFFVQKSDF